MRAIVLLCAVAVLAGSAGRPAQETLDEGTFRLYRRGLPVGEERFVIRSERGRNGPVTKAIGNVTLERGEERVRISVALEATGPAMRPTGYQVEISSDGGRKIAGVVQGGRFLARILSERGERLKEYTVSEGAVILDDDIVHHHFFVAQRAARGISRLPVLIPQRDQELPADVQILGVARTSVGTRTLDLTHIVVRPRGAPERHVYTDERYRVMKVEIPETGFEAIRTPKEAL
ncbi:MAG: hypothetical protein HY702_07200 [Gemmatimonadetes bacterium]|nr:hypothetical protein [Gemmatimonadota bacterium]